jgi:hypothetical protein
MVNLQKQNLAMVNLIWTMPSTSTRLAIFRMIQMELHLCLVWGIFAHLNMKICTHKNRLEVELLCNCSLTSKVIQCNAMNFTKNLMHCVHLEDTKTLWENRNSPWWNVKGHYVDVHSMSRLMFEPLLFHSS